MDEPRKGHISREFTVWCGLCDEWQQEGASTQAIAIKYFKTSGWRNTKANGWVCKNHDKDSEKPQNKPKDDGLPLCTKCGAVPSMMGYDVCYVCKTY